ncbi:MAG: Fpg/Nei family DNA glycosylase [Micrococcales bacterium]|nr:Fpg/Nei family DNA glycosylase [Micrococcales bacterium]MCL2668583.1 Fpg/Nei family DNA glycosylase [Micrococcales bacterium]
MPEGDALRITAARLDDALAGHVLVRAELRWPTAAGADLVGRTVRHTRPFGKHLLTRFDDGRTLHTHLRMDGAWRVVPSGSSHAQARSHRVRAVLATETDTALGIDLGMLDLVPTSREHELVAHLGPDILDDGFDTGTGPPGPGLAEAVTRWARRGPTRVCDVLLDQEVVAGIGTIWMAESLFAHRVYPWTPADQVDPVTILRTARRRMADSAAGHATIHVHSRQGRPCPRCGTLVARGQARQPPHERPVFWCPTCQAQAPA